MYTTCDEIIKSPSKYIKQARESVIFHKCSIWFIISLYMFPPYFGIMLPGFDLTALRLMILILFVMIFADYDRSKSFISTIKSEKITIFIGFFVFVTFYTMVFRTDFNCFLNPFIEFIELFLLIYVIKDNVGIDVTFNLIISFLYILAFLGLIEAAIGKTPFLLLLTIKRVTLYSGAFIRNGSYRIMSNCGHSLGYGMLLVSSLPFAGIDVKKREYDIFRRPVLLFGLIINVFLTGSRSSLGILALELVMMFVLTDRKYHKRNILISIIGIVFFTIFLFCIQSTGIGRYILLQITGLVDSLFHTTFSVKYGADMTVMGGSSGYRGALWKVFSVNWLNPILGLGKQRTFSSVIDGVVVRSIDNYYVVLFIQYAYPGFIAFCAMVIYMIIKILKECVASKSALSRTLLIGVTGYCVHLSIADSLGTLKYLYLLFALFLSYTSVMKEHRNDEVYLAKKESRYVRK